MEKFRVMNRGFGAVLLPTDGIRAVTLLRRVICALLLSLALMNQAEAQQYYFTTLAGSVGNSGSGDGWGSSARFSSPRSLSFDSATNLCIADSGNNRIRKSTLAGAVTTFATLYSYSNPFGIATDSSNNIFVACAGDYIIIKLGPLGTTTVFAGHDGSPGCYDGPALSSYFSSPEGVVVDSSNNVYVADTGNDTIRKITPGGIVSTIAGQTGFAGNFDGVGTNAYFWYPVNLAIDSANNI